MGHHVDEDHRGPLVNVGAWITVTIAVVAAVAKVFSKWRMTSSFNFDDGFMTLSMIFAIGTTVAIGLQVDNGLGQHQNTLSQDMVNRFQQILLGTNIIYVATVFSAKVSTLFFLRAITRPSKRQTFIKYFIGALIAWPIIAVFVIAFRCSTPHTWDLLTGKCYNTDAFWIVNGVIDIITQIVVAFLPIFLLHDVQISGKKRRLRYYLAMPVITTVPFEILRVISIVQSHAAEDITYNVFFPSLYTVLHANYSVIASCSTFLVPIAEAMSVGTISSEVFFIQKTNKPNIRRSEFPFGPNSQSAGNSYPLTDKSGKNMDASHNGTLHSKRRTVLWPTSTAKGGSKRSSAIFNVLPPTHNASVTARSSDHHHKKPRSFESTEPLVIEQTTTIEVSAAERETSTNAKDQADDIC